MGRAGRSDAEGIPGRQDCLVGDYRNGGAARDVRQRLPVVPVHGLLEQLHPNAGIHQVSDKRQSRLRCEALVAVQAQREAGRGSSDGVDPGLILLGRGAAHFDLQAPKTVSHRFASPRRRRFRRQEGNRKVGDNSRSGAAQPAPERQAAPGGQRIQQRGLDGRAAGGVVRERLAQSFPPYLRAVHGLAHQLCRSRGHGKLQTGGSLAGHITGGGGLSPAFHPAVKPGGDPDHLRHRGAALRALEGSLQQQVHPFRRDRGNP